MSLKELEKEISIKKKFPKGKITEEIKKECIEILTPSIASFSNELEKIKENKVRQNAENIASEITEVQIIDNNYKYKDKIISIFNIKNKEWLIKWIKEINLKEKEKIAYKYWLKYDKENDRIIYKWIYRWYTESYPTIMKWKKEVEENIKNQEYEKEYKKYIKERNQEIIKWIKHWTQSILLAGLVIIGANKYHKSHTIDYYQRSMSSMNYIDKRANKYLSKFNIVDFTGFRGLLNYKEIAYISKFQAKKIIFDKIEINIDHLDFLLQYQWKIIVNKLKIKDFQYIHKETLIKLLKNNEIKTLIIEGNWISKTSLEILVKIFNWKRLVLKWVNIDKKLIEIVNQSNYTLKLENIEKISIEEYLNLIKSKNIQFNKEETLNKILDEIELTPTNIALLNKIEHKINLGELENIDQETFRLLQNSENIEFDKEYVIRNMIFSNNPQTISQIDSLEYKTNFGYFSWISKESYIALNKLKNISFDREDTLKYLNIKLSPSNILWLDSQWIDIDLGTIKDINLDTFKALLETKHISFDKKASIEEIKKDIKKDSSNIYKIYNSWIKINLGILEWINIYQFEILQRMKNISFDEINTARKIAKELNNKRDLSREEFEFIVKHKGKKYQTINWINIAILSLNKLKTDRNAVKIIKQYDIEWLEAWDYWLNYKIVDFVRESNLKYLALNKITNLSNTEIEYISKLNLTFLELNWIKRLSHENIKLLAESNIRYISITGINEVNKDSINLILSKEDKFNLNSSMEKTLKKVRKYDNINKYYNIYLAPRFSEVTLDVKDNKTINLLNNKYPPCIFQENGMIENTPCYSTEKVEGEMQFVIIK